MTEQKKMTDEEKRKAEELERQRKRAARRKLRASARQQASQSGRKLGRWRGTFATIKSGTDAGRRWHVRLGIETETL